MEFKIVESVGIEVILNGSKWLFSGLYKPPSATESDCYDDFIKTMDKITVHYDNFVFLGDLNYDMKHPDKCKNLMEICDIFDLTNMVKESTCFKDVPSLIDVILTNTPGKIVKV